MSSRLDQALTITLIAATLAVAGSVVYRLVDPRPSVGPLDVEVPVFQADWKRVLASGGTLIGDDSAAITFVEFTDLECPACRAYQPGLEELVARYPGLVRLHYVPYPLSIHRFAMGAARVADCVLEQDRSALHRWTEVVFAGQDSLGLKSWGAFAADASLPDTLHLADCATAPGTPVRINSSMAYAETIGVSGTPTIMVNGWLYRGLPSIRTLEELIIKLRDGVQNVDG